MATRKQKIEDDGMMSMPIVFRMPAEMIEEFKGSKEKNDKELSATITDLQKGMYALSNSLTRHRMESQSSLLQHKKSTQEEIKKHGDNVSQIEKELMEAFGVLWPKFEKIEKSIKDNNSSSDKKHKGHEAKILEHAEQIAELSRTIEKRYQNALKKINQQKDKVEIRIDNGEVKLVRDEITRLEKLIKDAGKYEYGSSLNILNAAVPVGFTGALNFKSGFTIALNPSGYIDVTANAGAGNNFVYNEVVSGSGTTFTLAHTPKAGLLTVFERGQKILPTTGYTISGAVITTVDTLSAGDIVADYQWS